MKKWHFAVLLPALLATTAYALSINSHSSKKAEVKTVPFVDLKRYTGKWFEIARLPVRFQKQCIGNVTAEYTLKPNGNIEVLNKCLKKDGQYDDAKGKAKVVDKTTNAKLKVSFFLFFYAPYWIIDLDPDYNYAVVGNPNRKYLWILSRTPALDDKTYQNILRKVEKMGYKPNELIKTPQNVQNIKGEVLEKPQH